ncbi:MAG: hypothetical protein AAF743_09095 [Planctomycetota bacterium]
MSLHIRQRQFLHKLLVAEDSVADILQRLRVRPGTLLGWLDDQAFRTAVSDIRRQLGRRRELEVALGAASAAALLRRATDDGELLANTQQRRACVELIKLARERRRRATTPEESTPDIELDPDLVRELTEAEG